MKTAGSQGAMTLTVPTKEAWSPDLPGSRSRMGSRVYEWGNRGPAEGSAGLPSCRPRARPGSGVTNPALC